MCSGISLPLVATRATLWTWWTRCRRDADAVPTRCRRDADAINRVATGSANPQRRKGVLLFPFLNRAEKLELYYRSAFMSVYTACFHGVLLYYFTPGLL